MGRMAEITIMKTLHFPKSILADTLERLTMRGTADTERVVLWLGKGSGNEDTVSEVFTPQQQTAADYFRIPPSGMEEILSHLRISRLKIIAQVHSHPFEAFHSAADDTWALIRHVGALSLVIPHFGLHTSVETFWRDAAVYELSEDGRWEEVLESNLNISAHE